MSTEFRINEVNDECSELFVNGKYVCSASHDEHGFVGMKLLETVVSRIAATIGGNVVRTYSEEQE